MHEHNTKSNINLVLHRFYRNKLVQHVLSWRCSRPSKVNGLSFINAKVGRTSAVLALLLLVLTTSAALVPIYNNVSITEAASAYTESTLSLSVTNDTVAVDLSINSSDGTFASSGTPAKFKVSTNNYTGYTVSIKSNNSNTALTNTAANSDGTYATLTSIASAINNDVYSTDSAYNGTWGYYPNKFNSSTNNYYRPAPTASGNILDKTSVANTTNNSNEYTVNIGARANYGQASGTYTGTYVLTVVGNNVSYAINYNNNVGASGDTVSNMPSAQSSATSQQYITIRTNTPTRTGYTFNGWCTNHTTSNPTTTLADGSTTCPSSATTLVPGASSATNKFYIDQTTNNTATLYALWTRNSTTYTLIYDANNGAGVPTSQSNTNNNGSYTFTLSTSTIPTRSGYTFLGYDAVSTAVTPTYTYAMGTGTNGANGIFSPNTITLTQSSMSSAAESTTLYAVWKKDPVNELTSFTYIQDVTVEACGNTDAGQVATVKDIRDNTEYTIGKLADGHCWLLDNLALDLTSDTIQSNLTSATTNATNTELNYLKNGGGTGRYATYPIDTYPPSPTYGHYDRPTIATNGNCADAFCVNNPSDGQWTYTATTPATINNMSSPYQGKIGIYYNYCAVTAGTYCYDGSNGTSKTINSDICPSGWRIPTGNTDGEYRALYNSYKTEPDQLVAFQTALHSPLSGTFNTGMATGQGQVAYYWTSTLDTRNAMYNAYYIAITTSGILSTSAIGRRSSNSIRCILDERTILDVAYMQDVTSAIVDNTNNNATTILKDKRDETEYTVAKINGNLWMTQNLAIAGADGIVYGEESNFSADSVNIMQSDFDGGAAYQKTSSRTHLPTEEDLLTTGLTAAQLGAWYNYCAATARTICKDYPMTSAAEDICPRNWKLPSRDDAKTVAVSTYKTIFSPVYSRFIYGDDGHMYGNAYGYWRTSTLFNYSGYTYGIVYNSAGKLYIDTSGVDNGWGIPIRCIFSGN